MAKGKSKGNTQYGVYKSSGRYAANKKAKLERHLNKFPNDEQAKEALKNISASPKRKVPSTKVWKPQAIEIAQMYSFIGLNGNHALGGKASEKVGDSEHLRYDATHKEHLNKQRNKSPLDDVPLNGKKSKMSKKQ